MKGASCKGRAFFSAGMNCPRSALAHGGGRMYGAGWAADSAGEARRMVIARAGISTTPCWPIFSVKRALACSVIGGIAVAGLAPIGVSFLAVLAS
ncbi:hypothetical protein [Janthinobacterium sp. PC23-8]|uniref:hypothetical protein n=1 Tax=Janthinobacterium sp. PC23-8 TaxID=2012679 RepID=UPI00159606C9|nr:hypothetical protein [Janthinobacterium sp. PC23-8]